jgi:hypothetical protein
MRTAIIRNQYRRPLAEVREAASDHAASARRLAAAAIAAHGSGVPAVTVARAAMRADSPAGLAVVEIALFGQCSYPAPERPAPATPQEDQT